jgi:hypothetical protein
MCAHAVQSSAPRWRAPPPPPHFPVVSLSPRRTPLPVDTDLSVIQAVVQDTQLLASFASQRKGRGQGVCGEAPPPGLVYVLVYDLLFGRGFTPMGDTELTVCASEPALREALQKQMSLVRAVQPSHAVGCLCRAALVIVSVWI